ncbi:ABC transporter permease [Aminobacter sp. HY435]|uniref:ABC transporter permease n=1 Tax=Aminobacter sp. HY435 TaxID=2970917 RepID=UPI0022B991A3|nr:ABC transporter permease [Aminobacter sp. HY435]
MTLRTTIAVCFFVCLVLGGLWQPHDPDAVDLAARHAPTSLNHLLGTDHLGRDLASRIMAGGWRTALVILAVGLIGFFGGSILGTGAAILGGWREALILRFAEMFIVVPTLIVALTTAALFGLSPLTAGLALGLAGVGPQALLSHSLTRRVLGRTYVQAARALGATTPRLMLRHVLPNTIPLTFTYVGSQSGLAVVAYASLAFIGLGADPSKPDWGSMLFEYRIFIFDNPGLMIWPGVAIALTAGLLNWLFDPVEPQGRNFPDVTDN